MSSLATNSNGVQSIERLLGRSHPFRDIRFCVSWVRIHHGAFLFTQAEGAQLTSDPRQPQTSLPVKKVAKVMHYPAFQVRTSPDPRAGKVAPLCRFTLNISS